MERFEFFNKQEITVEDLNLAFEIKERNWQRIFAATFTKGWLENSNYLPNEIINLGQIIKPTFIAGSAPNKVSIKFEAGKYIIGIDEQCNPIIIFRNMNYTTGSIEYRERGNIDIPLENGDGDYYIWLVYHEFSMNIPPLVRQDYDGAIKYPFKTFGYDIVILYNNPTPYNTGLLVGKVTLSGNTQSYDYSNQIIAGLRDKNIKIKIDSSNKTQVYNDGDIKTLNEHINAIGNGIIKSNNPHGLIAHDINAIDLNTLNSSALALNGISGYNITGYSMYSEAIFGAIYNSITENYVYLFVGDIISTWSIFFNGKRYSASMTQPKYSDNTARIYFDNNDSEGEYVIYLTLENEADNFLTLKKQKYDGYYTPQNKIELGRVYWVNSGGIKQLRPHFKVVNPPNGTGIQHNFEFWGYIPPENIKFNFRKFLTNKNLLPNGDFKYGLYSTAIGEYNNYIDVSEYFPSYISIEESGNDKYLKLSNLANNRKIKFKVKNIQRKIYNPILTFSFFIRGNFTNNNSYIKIYGGNGTSGLRVLYPDFDLSSWRYYFLDFLAIADTAEIILEFVGTFNVNDYVLLDNLQVLAGKNYQYQLMYNFTTNEIFHDKNISVFEKRTQIENINLDNILHKIPVNTFSINQPNQGYFDETKFIDRNIETSTSLDNLELHIVRTFLRYDSIVGRHRGDINYDSNKYKLVWCNVFQILEFMSGSEMNHVYIRDVGNGFISLDTTLPTTSTIQPIPVVGMLILRRINE